MAIVSLFTNESKTRAEGGLIAFNFFLFLRGPGGGQHHTITLYLRSQGLDWTGTPWRLWAPRPSIGSSKRHRHLLSSTLFFLPHTSSHLFILILVFKVFYPCLFFYPPFLLNALRMTHAPSTLFLHPATRVAATKHCPK